MKIEHVAARPDITGGITYTIPSLCRVIADQGHDVTLHLLEPGLSPSDRRFDVRTYPTSGPLARIGGSPKMKAALRAAAADANIMHSHLLWRMPNVYPAGAVAGTRCRLVISPRGTLDAWAFRHRRLRKLPLWYGGQRANFTRAACIHVTAEIEYELVRGHGFKAPVMLIPNGVDIPPLEAKERDGLRRLLFLARIHPKKGVEVALRAWRNVQQRFSDWELRVVGPDNEGHLDEMRRLAVELGLRRAELVGYVSEERKVEEYRSADLYILPTHAENWGVTVADALAAAVPAIVGKRAPWSGLETRDCGWWIDNSVESVTQCLEVALGCSPEELRAKGQRGRTWMATEFPWSRIAGQTLEAYRWLMDGGTPPRCVKLD